MPLDRIGLPEPAYLFIDAGHLRDCYNLAMGEWFECDSEVDYAELKIRVRAFKLFYYDCMDDIKRPNETEKDFKSRVETQGAKFDSISSIIGAHVRLGSLAGVSEKRRRQKGVDILLAVDMMNYAIRKTMRRAVLLTGDADFKPLVESLVQLGMFVEIVGDHKRTSRDLVRAADASELLAFDEYYTLAPAELRRFPFPDKSTIAYKKEYYEGKLLGYGKIGGHQVPLSFTDRYNVYIPTGLAHAHVLRHLDFERLKLYLKIQFPDLVLDG